MYIHLYTRWIKHINTLTNTHLNGSTSLLFKCSMTNAFAYFTAFLEFLLFIKRSEYHNKLHTTGKCAGSTESISIFWGQIYTICCFGCASRKIKWMTLQNSNPFQ